MKSGTSWRTSLNGWITGLVPVGYAVITAIQNHELDGMHGMLLVLGIGRIVSGQLSKDKQVTGAGSSATTITN